MHTLGQYCFVNCFVYPREAFKVSLMLPHTVSKMPLPLCEQDNTDWSSDGFFWVAPRMPACPVCSPGSCQFPSLQPFFLLPVDGGFGRSWLLLQGMISFPQVVAFKAFAWYSPLPILLPLNFRRFCRSSSSVCGADCRFCQWSQRESVPSVPPASVKRITRPGVFSSGNWICCLCFHCCQGSNWTHFCLLLSPIAPCNPLSQEMFITVWHSLSALNDTHQSSPQAPPFWRPCGCPQSAAYAGVCNTLIRVMSERTRQPEQYVVTILVQNGCRESPQCVLYGHSNAVVESQGGQSRDI